MERLSEVLQKQREYRWTMAQTTAQQRIERLKKVRDKVFSWQDKIYEALEKDFRKNSAETELTEVQTVISEINFAIKKLSKWMKPVRVKAPLTLLGTHSSLHYEPKGNVLIISPWNYPFNLCVIPVISAIAAGNTVVVKPSELTPHTSKLINEMFNEIFPEEEVAVFEGDVSVAQALLNEKFDHIFFTGSSHVGRMVMESAARNLTSVTLELGGKSPVIVDRKANIKKTAQRVVWGKFLNGGQTCVAPDYVLVPKEQQQDFIAEAQNVIKKFYGDTEELRKNTPDFCRIVNARHFQRLQDVLERSIAQGAQVAIGGECDASQNYISPTLLTEVQENTPIMEDEIFGPILPIITYEDLDKALELIHKREKPLALYIFSESNKAIKDLLRKTTAGGSCINDVVIHLANPHLPFGGVNNSGLGSYHGYFGFKAFSHERAVLKQGILSALPLFYPPYTPFVKKLMQKVTRYLA